jgi:hypothetical protein
VCVYYYVPNTKMCAWGKVVEDMCYELRYDEQRLVECVFVSKL